MKLKISIQFLLILFCYNALDVSCYKMFYKLSARNLPLMDEPGETEEADAFARIYLNNQLIGETDQIDQESNPDWPNLLEVNQTADHDYISLMILDRERDFSTELIGWVNFFASAINKIGYTTFPIINGERNRGTVIVRTVTITDNF